MKRKYIISILVVLFILSVWIFFLFFDRVINGYTDRFSYYPGETMSIFLNPSRTLTNFEVGLYDINKKKITSVVADLYRQDTAKHRPWENGFGYKETFTFKIPQLKSGVYLWEKKVPFIVKAREPKIIILYNSNTINAYNTAGGKSLYSYDTVTNRFNNAVSVLRPTSVSYYAHEFLKWFGETDYQDVGYICDYDMENYDHIKDANLLLIIGHSEYWTRKARENFDRFISEGRDAIILSGNTMWWQVRYNERGNQLLCYKSFDHDTISNPLLKTVNWDQPVLNYPILNSIGVDFGRAGFGKEKDKGWNGYKIINENSPLLEGTGLKNGDFIKFESHEQDGTALNGADSKGNLIVDRELLNFKKIEIIGYDSVSGYLHDKAVATWITMQATDSSGVVINVATTNWCSSAFKNEGEVVKKITKNMIDKLLNKQNVFSFQ